MASEYIQSVWELFTWRTTSELTTAESLANACDTHIQKKETDLANVREQESTQEALLAKATVTTKQTKDDMEAETSSMDDAVSAMKERFKSVRDAINLALETSSRDDSIEGLKHLCTMVEGFSATEFEQKMTQFRSAVRFKRAMHDDATEKEQCMRSTLGGIVSDRKKIESHIREIKDIKAELNQRLDPENPAVNNFYLDQETHDV